MAKKRVFISFDYDHDLGLKEDLVAQARRPDSPFTINDFSLQEAYPAADWFSKAQSRIARCDVFIVVLGANTTTAQGVIREVKIAQGRKKNRFQLRVKGETHGGVPGGGSIVNWRWPNLKRAING